MIPIRFSTSKLPAAQQLAAWKGWFDGVFDVATEESETGFDAGSVVWTAGDFGLSHVRAPALTALRGKRLLRSNPIDHWVITLGQSRTVGEGGDGVALDIPARTPFVVSLGRELVSRRSQDERLQLYLPRDAFRELAPVLDAAQGVAFATPMGRLLGDYITILNSNLPDIEATDLPRLTNAVRAMVLACTAPSSDRLDLATSQIHLTKRERVRQFIDANLRHAGLDTVMLCREMGMSRTQLYRLLQADGGVAHYIRRRRLRRSYADLSDPANTATITAIADSLCFEDASSFSRAFKQEFGVNPRDVRAVALAGLPPLVKLRESEGPMPTTLRECLLRF